MENDIDTLFELLRKGVAHFFYRKKDGTIREAYGTLNDEILDKANIPRGQSRYDHSKRNPGSLTYFDLLSQDKRTDQRGAFRCLTKENLIQIDFNYAE